MSIEWIPLTDSKRWDSVVQSFKKSDIYYQHGYAKSFGMITEGKPYLIYSSSEKFKACNVVQLRKIPGSTLFDLTSLYGYGGWVIEGEPSKDDIAQLLNSYQRSCRDRKIVSEIIRAHPNCCDIARFNAWYEQQEIGPIVNIDLTQNDLWGDVPSKSKNVIRKAEKLGVQISSGGSDLLTPEAFKNIYDETMERAGAADFYFFPTSFHQAFDQYLKASFSYFTAELDGNLLGAAIITHNNGTMNYHLSGSNKSARGIPAMNLLIYKAMEWGAENGFETFNLGGGVGTMEDSLFKFKKSFTKSEPTMYSILKKVFDEDAYTELAESRVDTGKGLVEHFFPRYRAPLTGSA